MFFKTIRYKILLAVCVSFLFFTVCTFVVCFVYYKNNKGMANVACSAMIEKYSTDINATINRLFDLSNNLSILGEMFYRLNTKNHKELEWSVFKVFSNNDSKITFSGGVWYEPYIIKSSQERFCACATHNNKENVWEVNSFFESEQYNYLSRMWYMSAKSFVNQYKKTIISRPYFGATGTKEPMITICTGIFDSKGKFIGTSSVDWELQAIIKNLANIKITKNTFVLFANKKHDFILVLNYDNDDVDKNIGKSLSTIEWYSENLKNETRFFYNKKEYVCFIKHLFDDFVLCINVPTKELYYNIHNILKIVVIIFLLSIILSVFIIFRILQYNIEKPIQYLVEKAKEYTSGIFNIKFNICSSIEFSILASTFNNMITSIKEHATRLAIADTTKKNIERELKIARTIQSSNLKTIFPPYPNRKEFDIFATMEPAKEVGGDFYDFFFLDDNHFVFLIADVSDKGIPAALFMMESKGVIKNSIERFPLLNEAIEKANNKLYKSNDAGFFITAFIAILDVKTGILEYINAGHNKPLLKLASSKYSYIDTKGNVALGVFDNIKYNTHKVHFPKNSALLLYTDGITEAQNTKKEFFGEQRLMDTMNEFSSTAKNNIDNLKNTIKSFCDGAQQYDDMTMLNIIYKSEETDRLIVGAKVDNWSIVYNFLTKNMIDKKIKKEYQSKVLLASEEIFINIANYAYEKEKDGKVWITTEKTDITYDIVFVDAGKQYNPLEKKEPDVNASLKDRQVGGLGIYLVKKIMDKVEYKYENLKNIFTISINLQK